MDARDALSIAADANEEQRWPAHLVALLGDDPGAVGDAVPDEVRPKRAIRGSGRGILGDPLPRCVHPAVHRGAWLDGLRGEDVRGLAKGSRRGALDGVEG